MKNFSKTPRQRGSALLIVLGFLSFMMISAVSFAIYMRIERQASSNYRHSVQARHLLNSGLYRAIDEIDTELRDTPLSGCKFPRNWTGRLRASASGTNDAHVLSLEALSYIPAVLINDVRRYAVRNEDVDETWEGAKWRDLPGGRYAYVCVNLSDMLDVNVCKAQFRDSVTNRVSISHLFTSDNNRKAFDENFKNLDKHYETLQDFYTCMDDHVAPAVFDSPYHNLIDSQDYLGLNKAAKHVLVTDSIVKPEPTRSGAVNITDPAFQNDLEKAVTACAAQLATIPRLNGPNADEHFRFALMDYLDEDNKPYWRSGQGVGGLYRPSTEMVPMVFQSILNQNSLTLAPAVTSTTVGTGASAVTTFKLKLTSLTSVNVIFQCMFPFKNWEARKNKDAAAFDFTLDARAYLVAVVGDGSDLKTQDDTLKSLRSPNSFKLDLSGGSLDLKMNSETEVVKACLANFTVPPCEMDLYSKDSHGAVTWLNGLNPGNSIRLAVVVFAGVKQGGQFVDMAPGFWHPAVAAPSDLDAAITSNPGIMDRLFFQTTAIPVTDSMPGAPPCTFEWTSLEVPDPRFNHRASNWITGSRTTQDPNIDNTLAKSVVGQDGRDSDVYMFVSNAGRLFSPGEFGFLVRPVADESAQPDNRTLKGNATADRAQDYDYMFRTLRLYDHGDPSSDAVKRAFDPIYKYFIAQNPDGTQPGARVNPFSDLPQVLSAAIESTPLDYWVASLDSTKTSELSVMQDKNFTKYLSISDWTKFTNAWSQCLINAQKTSTMNSSWNTGLSDVYPLWSKFGWYSDANPNKIFDGGYTVSGVPATLSTPLHEIDRKMLFSFSQDSFSDRQQLFLYIVRSEATVPFFGNAAGSGMKSLAGGRAVALVWRDPYPIDYNKENNTWNPNSFDYYPNINSASLWKPYHSGSTPSRKNSYHQHRILYFKQLDN